MVGIAQVAELPDQLGALACWANWVIQRYQAAAATGIHEEGGIGRMEQEGFVTRQGQAAIGLVGGHQDLVGTFQFFGTGLMDDRAFGAQQPGQGYRHQQYRGTQQ